MNGTQSKPATCSEVSAIWKCMSEIWGIPPLKIGDPTIFFSTTSQLNYNLTAFIFGMKHAFIFGMKRKCFENYKGSSTSSQNVMNFGSQTV